MGGALTAVSPDFTRASLGGPGDELLGAVARARSTSTNSPMFLYPAYPDEENRPLIFEPYAAAVGPGEPEGYAARMTSETRCLNTPAPPGCMLGRRLRRPVQVTDYQAYVDGTDDRRARAPAGQSTKDSLAVGAAVVGTSEQSNRTRTRGRRSTTGDGGTDSRNEPRLGAVFPRTEPPPV